MVAESGVGGGGRGSSHAVLQNSRAMYSTQKYPHSGLDRGSFKYLAPETEAVRGPDWKSQAPNSGESGERMEDAICMLAWRRRPLARGARQG